MRAILIRTESSVEGTFGQLVVEGWSCFTGELPWRNNARSISCIPLGEYRCIYTFSPRFRRKMYLIGPVSNRSGIRIHSANFMGDRSLGFKWQLNGCIALGQRLGSLAGQKAVLISRPAIRQFEQRIEGQTFTLEIRNG